MSGGPKYWDQDVPVTSGSSYPTITIEQADSRLRRDVAPPWWLACLQTPEAAMLFALAYSSPPASVSAQGMPLKLQAAGMLSPWNVALNPANAFLGYCNPQQSGLFGSLDLGSSYLPLGIQTANVAQNGLQGFAGSIGLQARVTAAFNGSATLSATYTFYDAAHGWGNAQSATLSATLPNNALVGSLALFTIPSGQIVTSVSTASQSAGTATSGAVVFESPAVRPL